MVGRRYRLRASINPALGLSGTLPKPNPGWIRHVSETFRDEYREIWLSNILRIYHGYIIMIIL